MIASMRSKDNLGSFTSGFSECLHALVSTLPANTATLEIGGDSDFLTFTISPVNQHSATIKGQASAQGGIAFRVGKATTMELSSSSEHRFIEVCKAVFGSYFTECVTYSSTGRTLYSRIELEKNGQKIRLGGHQLFWWLFPNRQSEKFAFEPYWTKVGGAQDAVD